MGLFDQFLLLLGARKVLGSIEKENLKRVREEKERLARIERAEREAQYWEDEADELQYEMDDWQDDIDDLEDEMYE